MIPVASLLDITPGAGVVAGAVAIAFFLALAGVAAVAFFALKRTVEMAFRLAVVAVVLIVAVVGSASLWYFASPSQKAPKRPPPPANGRR